MTKAKFTTEELRERRYRQYWESLARYGRASVCPECGKYTKSVTGFHRSCAKKAQIGR